MRRAAGLAARLAGSAGTLRAAEQQQQQQLLASCGAAAAGLQLQAARGLAGGGGGGGGGGQPPQIVPNPLQQIVPPIIKGIRAAVDGLGAGQRALVDQLTSGPATRGAIAYLADNVLLSGRFVDAASLDLPKWAAWLAGNGYTSKAGWDALVAGVKAAADAGALGPAEVEALAPALESVGRYDRALYGQFADVVKARFAEFTTEGLCKLLPIFAAHDYFDQDLWDDAADSVAYCNHYLSASRVPLPDVAAFLAAYARYEVDRGDLFVVLARCVHEDTVKALDDADFKLVVGSLLSSFKALKFYPDAAQALLVAARLRPGPLGPAENALAAEVEAELRGHAPDGKLPWLDGGFKDAEHFHGAAFGSYELWVTRDELTPAYYRPSDISPRPASMTAPPPPPPSAPSAGAA